ncbi:MAG: bile acid:sodium symporter family protein [Spirochaetia bacterium]|nr:bile acid:sodium symporter family protein [Spirochaetia bacterium]
MFHFTPFETRLRRLNTYLERIMPILTPSGVILGLLLGSHVSSMKGSVNYLFALITFIGALGISSGDFFKVLRKPKAIFLAILTTNILMPLIAFLMANLFFPNQNEVITGFILITAIPTALTGYIWSNIYRGHAALSLTLILIGTILAPLLTPFTVQLLARTAIQIDTTGMMVSLLVMVVLPSIAGIAINNMTRGKVNDHIAPSLKPFAKIGLFIIIVVNTSQVAERLIANATWAYLPIALSCAALAAIGYPISHTLGKLAKLDIAQQKSVTFASSMRNISAALVLSINYFPAQTALPVIFGIVFQQTVCALMAYLLYGRKKIY